MGGLKLELDPEVEGLLREIAADPRSTLLRIPRPVNLRAFAEDRPAFGVATAGLTKAERHLVQTRREEVAHALRTAAFFRIVNAPAIRRSISFQREGALEYLGVPTRDHVEAIALAAAGDELPEAPNIVGLVGMSLDGGDALSCVLELSGLAHRLVPCANSTIHASVALLRASPMRAESTLVPLLSNPSTSWERAVALSNVALSRCERGQFEVALDHYRAAVIVRPDNVNCLASLLVLSVRMGEAAGFDTAAGLLDDAIGKGDAAGMEMIDELGRAFRQRSDPMSNAERTAAWMSKCRPGGNAWRLLDAFRGVQ